MMSYIIHVKGVTLWHVWWSRYCGIAVSSMYRHFRWIITSSVPRFERPRRSFSSLLGAYFPRSPRSIHRWNRNEKRKLRLADCIHLYRTVFKLQALIYEYPRRRKIGWSYSACDGGRPYRATTPCDTLLESPCNAQHFMLWQCASILNRLRVIKP